MAQAQGVAAGADLAALRAQNRVMVIGGQPGGTGQVDPSPAPPKGESYGGSVRQFVAAHPKLTTAGAAVAAGCVVTRTNPFTYIKDRIASTLLTAAGMAGGGVATWVALHAGADALTSVANAAALGTGLVETAVGVGLVGAGAWVGRAIARCRINARQQATASAKSHEPPSALVASLPRATALVLAGAALPHIVAHINRKNNE